MVNALGFEFHAQGIAAPKRTQFSIIFIENGFFAVSRLSVRNRLIGVKSDLAGIAFDSIPREPLRIDEGLAGNTLI